MRNLTIIIFSIATVLKVVAKENEYYDVFDKDMTQTCSFASSVQDGATPLIKAVRQGSLPEVRRLVQRGHDVNEGVKQDSSPLIEACRLGYLHITQFLVEHGADVNLHVIGDETPLIRAAWNGHLHIVKYLIENGADVNLTVRESYRLGAEKRNALRMAKIGNHGEVVSFLIENGAN
ncbi:MAG: ankyrin repeat domain-containing protein [Bacteroidota bacterium]